MIIYRHVTFAEPVLYHPASKDREFHVELSLFGIRPNGYVLIDRYKLPLVSRPYDLADWSREITEAEYLDLVGPADIEALRAKHPGLRCMMEWRKKLGHETDYGQIERIFLLVSEFKRGNRPLRYQFTVSDMG